MKEQAKNTLKHKAGPWGAAKRLWTSHLFKLSYKDKIIVLIVKYTNNSVEVILFLKQFGDVLYKYLYFYKINDVNIRKRLGIVYVHAIINFNLSDLCSSSVSRNCYGFIFKFKTFDDKLTQNDQWKTNKVTLIREIFQ